MSAVRLYDAVHHRKPQFGSFADLLCREEGLEYPILDLRRDLASGVIHPEMDVSTGLPVAVQTCILRIEVDLFQGDL